MNTNTKTKMPEPATCAGLNCAESPASAGWVRGEAPKDGNLYVAMGRMVGCDKWGGHSTPFLSQVRWHCDADWGGWVDEHGLAISSDIDDRVYIDHWCALPNNGDMARGGSQPTNPKNNHE